VCARSCMCVCARVCACVRVRMCVPVCVRLCVHACACMCVRVCMCVHVCVRARVHVCYMLKKLPCNCGCTEHLNMLKTTLSFDNCPLPYRVPACSYPFFRLAIVYRQGRTQDWPKTKAVALDMSANCA